MSAPFLNSGAFSLDVGLVLAVIIGFGFGFALERAGFGSARKLAAQFYLYDMTVFKVMFTAIITAMVGLFGLIKLGFLNMDLLYINPTFIWPQLVGGLLLGAGFIISGYCPGTSIVASASGKIDGMFTILGVMGGIFLFGMVYTPELQAFHTSGSYGRLLLSDVFGIDPALLTMIIVFVAGLAFIFAEWVERKFSGWAKEYVIPTSNARLRYAVSITLLIVAAVFIMPFSGGGAKVLANTYDPVETIEPVALAQMIIEKETPVTVLDVRAMEKIEKAAIPGSMKSEAEQLGTAAFWVDTLPKHRYYVVVENGIKVDLAVPEGYRVVRLKGGFEAWKSAILTEPTAPENADEEAMADYKVQQAIYAYFTGAAVEAPKIQAPAPSFKASGGKKKKPSGGC